MNTSDGGREDKYSPRNIKQVVETLRSIQVEVLSSKLKVSVTIDGTTVSGYPCYRSVTRVGEEGWRWGRRDGDGGGVMEMGRRDGDGEGGMEMGEEGWRWGGGMEMGDE